MTALTIVGRGRVGRALAEALGGDVALESRHARPAGWVLLAVPDHAVASLAEHFPGRAVHLSGSLYLPGVPSSHPLTSFDGTAQDWTGTPLALTGSVPEAVVGCFVRLGFSPFELPPEHKALYHAAAVMTSGHAATLWIGAERLLREAGVALPGRGLWPLAEATLANIRAQGASGRTGPFVRGDRRTIAQDAAALPEGWREVFLRLGYALDDEGGRNPD